MAFEGLESAGKSFWPIKDLENRLGAGCEQRRAESRGHPSTAVWRLNVEETAEILNPNPHLASPDLGIIHPRASRPCSAPETYRLPEWV